jgi:hypothetical protein
MSKHASINGDTGELYDITPQQQSVSDLVETLAAIEHERWADWQKWVHKVSELHQDENGRDTI